MGKKRKKKRTSPKIPPFFQNNSNNNNGKPYPIPSLTSFPSIQFPSDHIILRASTNVLKNLLLHNDRFRTTHHRSCWPLWLPPSKLRPQPRIHVSSNIIRLGQGRVGHPVLRSNWCKINMGFRPFYCGCALFFLVIPLFGTWFIGGIWKIRPVRPRASVRR